MLKDMELNKEVSEVRSYSFWDSSFVFRRDYLFED